MPGWLLLAAVAITRRRQSVNKASRWLNIGIAMLRHVNAH